MPKRIIRAVKLVMKCCDDFFFQIDFKKCKILAHGSSLISIIEILLKIQPASNISQFTTVIVLISCLNLFEFLFSGHEKITEEHQVISVVLLQMFKKRKQKQIS